MNKKKQLKELKTLLEFSSPKALRRTVNNLFFDFVLKNNECLPANFNDTVTSIYFLNVFWENIDSE